MFGNNLQLQNNDYYFNYTTFNVNNLQFELVLICILLNINYIPNNWKSHIKYLILQHQL